MSINESTFQWLPPTGQHHEHQRLCVSVVCRQWFATDGPASCALAALRFSGLPPKGQHHAHQRVCMGISGSAVQWFATEMASIMSISRSAWASAALRLSGLLQESQHHEHQHVGISVVCHRRASIMSISGSAFQRFATQGPTS